MRVWDQYGVDFFLEKLCNCSPWDAHRILNCQKKALASNERAFLIPRDKFSIWGKSDFYIQKVSLPQKLQNSGNDEIFLAESIVAERCARVDKIDGQTWWLYAARHGSYLRMIAGLGKGIMLSRFLSLDADLADEISKTITYLRRFGLEKRIKIFSPFRNVKLREKVTSEMICEKFYISPWDGKNCTGVGAARPIVGGKNCFTKILNGRVLYVALAVVALILLGIEGRVRHVKRVISSLDKGVHVATKDMELKIDGENFLATKQFIDALEHSANPLESLRRASKICRKHNVSVEQLLWENGVKIKTSLDKVALDGMKSVPNVVVEKVSGDEYEELGSNKKFGAVLCIK